MKASTLTAITITTSLLVSLSPVQAYEPENARYVGKIDQWNVASSDYEGNLSAKDSDTVASKFTSESDSEEWNINLGIGAVTMSAPWVGSNTENIAVPFFDASIGNWHFGSEGLISYQTVVADQWGIAIGIDTRNEGYDSDFSDHKIFSGYEEPDDELIANVGIAYGLLSMQATQDISNNSDASSVSLSFELPVYENPKGIAISLTTSAYWYSSEYVNYYYGVTDQQVNNSVGRSAYQSEAAVNYELGLNAVYAINKQWMVVGSLSQTKLDEHITDSPLVGDDSQSVAAIVLVYQL